MSASTRVKIAVAAMALGSRGVKLRLKSPTVTVEVK